MVLDDRGDKTKAAHSQNNHTHIVLTPYAHTSPSVCSVDAHDVDAAQQELERLAQTARPVGRAKHVGPNLGPQRLRFTIALRRLHPPDDAHDRADEALAIDPIVGPPLYLTPDELGVDCLGDRIRLAAPRKINNAVADLGEHAEHSHVARRRKLEVVDQTVPESLPCG
jgi:hypothetical protein